MRAGRMRERVTFQTAVRTPDGAGGNTLGAFGSDQTTRAEIRIISNVNQIQAAQRELPILASVKIRYKSATVATGPNFRMVWNNKYFRIREVFDPDNKQFTQEIIVEELKPSRG